MMNEPMATVPFFRDWTFWLWVVALVSLVSSLGPQILKRLKGPKLSLDLHDRIQITHAVGNPNVSIFVMLRNVGSQPLRIRALKLKVMPREGAAFNVSAKGYLDKFTDSTQSFFAPFTLQPADDWHHLVQFFTAFSRADEQEFRKIVGANRDSILAKRKLLEHPEDTRQIVDADPSTVPPLVEFFRRKFIWNPGEYEFSLTAETEPARIAVTRVFRITLFETDSESLKRYVDDYKTGLGVWYFDINRQPGA
jgi:hypothetical protein